MLDIFFFFFFPPKKNELHMFVSIVKISPLFWVPEMWSMIIGILSFTENRITEVFQKVECGEGFLSIFFFSV